MRRPNGAPDMSNYTIDYEALREYLKSRGEKSIAADETERTANTIKKAKEKKYMTTKWSTLEEICLLCFVLF